jgi:hypothetical protein
MFGTVTAVDLDAEEKVFQGTPVKPPIELDEELVIGFQSMAPISSTPAPALQASPGDECVNKMRDSRLF